MLEESKFDDEDDVTYGREYSLLVEARVMIDNLRYDIKEYWLLPTSSIYVRVGG